MGSREWESRLSPTPYSLLPTPSTFIPAAFPLEALGSEGSGGAVRPGSFVRRGAKRPRCRHGILSARTRTSQLASPPRGTWQCIPWRPSIRTVRRLSSAAPPREPRQAELCHTRKVTGIKCHRACAWRRRSPCAGHVRPSLQPSHNMPRPSSWPARHERHPRVVSKTRQERQRGPTQASACARAVAGVRNPQAHPPMYRRRHTCHSARVSDMGNARPSHAKEGRT